MGPITLLFTLIVLGAMHQATAGVTQEQLTALQDLYDHWDGPKWVNAPLWEKRIHNMTLLEFQRICSNKSTVMVLDGVQCVDNNVYQIVLPGQGLVGPMLNYSTFFRYWNKLVLILDNNNLQGELPRDIPYDTTCLIHLSVQNNNLHGQVPDEIFFQQLQILDISLNQLDMTPLTPAVGNATNLQLLNVGLNGNTSGPIPAEICKCFQLYDFEITTNHFTGLPPCFASSLATSMQVLNLYDNDFTGPIPQDWCKMTNLKQLQLSNNQFSGAILPCFASFTVLSVLTYQNTLMTGPFPPWAFELSQLITFAASNLIGPVEDRFDELRMLRTAILQGPGIPATDPSQTLSGNLPKTLFTHPGLVSLIIQNTYFQGTLPNMTNATQLCQLLLLQNQLIAGVFPIELLTITWTSPIHMITEYQADRGFVIDACPLIGGLLPNLSDDQAKSIKNLSLAGSAFQLRNGAWYGWIPESLSLWLPMPSWNNFLLGNTQLFFPVEERFLNMTNQYEGLPMGVNSVIAGTPAPQKPAGSNVSISGSFAYLNSPYRVAFFEANVTVAYLQSVQASGGDDAVFNQSIYQVNASLPYGAVMSPSYYPAIYLAAPQVPEDVNALVATVFIDGSVLQNVNETKRVRWIAPQLVPFSFYTPQPQVTDVEPVDLRAEGCVPMTITGMGFTNAPNPTVVIESATALGHHTNANITISGSGVTVVNDTTITFLLPFANANDYSVTFANFSIETAFYPVRVYPAGVAYPTQVSNRTGSVMVEFIETCSGTLEACGNGHTDPFGCPLVSVCTCSNRGTCLSPNTTTNRNDTYLCGCDEHFTGDLCNECVMDRYGRECSACDCEHGTCNWGRGNDGTCDCDKGWMGGRCSVSKLAVGLGVGLAALAVGITVAAVAIVRHRRKQRFDMSSDDKPLL
jgi:hypothetical protein